MDAVNGFSQAGAERYAGVNVADAGNDYDDTFRRENLNRLSNLATDSMPGGSSWVDANGQWHVLVTGTSADVAPIDEVGGANASAVEDRRPYVVGEPLAVQGTGLSDGRSSAYSYWSDVQDAGANQGSFLRYAFGGTMRTLSGVGYDIAEAVVGAYEKPSDLRTGTLKAVANFGPDAFNGGANLLKTSLDGWTLAAEKLGASEGQFAGFRGSNPFNIDPLFSYDSKTQAGAGLLTNFGLGAGIAKFGGYGMVFEDIGAVGPMGSQMGAVRISLVNPNSAAGRLLVANREGMLYPEVPDLRTGRPIQFPDGEVARLDKAARNSWDSSSDRYAFIKEWHDRGYETPRGGWGEYDIHHVRPLEFGGDNKFWNLTPVQRQTHKEMFNKFWRGY